MAVAAGLILQLVVSANSFVCFPVYFVIFDCEFIFLETLSGGYVKFGFPVYSPREEE